MSEVKIGKVTHYFDKIGVAVIEVDATLSLGDKIKIIGPDHTVELTVSSMQVEHQQVDEARKGDAVGLKVDEQVKEGDEIFKLS
jgi:putative protease